MSKEEFRENMRWFLCIFIVTLSIALFIMGLIKLWLMLFDGWLQ